MEQIAFFDGLAEKWDSLCGLDQGKLRCLVELCGLSPGAKILDVACGTGLLAPYLLEKAPELVVGVDFSPAMVAKAQELHQDERLQFCCMDVMEYSQVGFDCAILYNAFPYFENRGSLTRHMHHLLRRNGRLLICHAQSRTQINAAHQNSAINLTRPLPTAQTLSGTLSQYFDVDTVIDSPYLYVVSGVRRELP